MSSILLRGFSVSFAPDEFLLLSATVVATGDVFVADDLPTLRDLPATDGTDVLPDDDDEPTFSSASALVRYLDEAVLPEFRCD